MLFDGRVTCVGWPFLVTGHLRAHGLQALAGHVAQMSRIIRAASDGLGMDYTR